MTAHPPRRAAKPADSKACGPRGEPSARAGSAAADPSRQRRSELTARLVHDVGKYLARTARNLPAGCALDAALLDMLCRDLYGDARSPRPSARFAELAAELAPLLAAEPVVAARGEGAKLATLPAAEPVVAARGEGTELATPLAAAPPAAGGGVQSLSVIGGELAELDGLEPQVRAGASVAVLRAVELARRVEQQLRALATAGQRPTKRSAR